MKLSNVLATIKAPEGEKTASAVSSSNAASKTAANTSDALKAALKEATAPAAVATEKKASAGSPAADLLKTAADMAGAEHEALVKEAHLYGSAVCDGFMVRMSQYNQTLGHVAAPATKVAAADDTFEKFASENPSLVKEAAELGYSTTLGQMDKLAGAAYENGYNEAVGTIYKLAHDSFCAGFEDTLRLVNSIR